jgi:hypothetical protein
MKLFTNACTSLHMLTSSRLGIIRPVPSDLGRHSNICSLHGLHHNCCTTGCFWLHAPLARMDDLGWSGSNNFLESSQ